MTSSSSEQDSAVRANRLYWGSDRSVNELAEDLDLSKGALYGLISPLDAGLDCPDCSGTLEYANRTARDKGFVTCAECGVEEEEVLVRAEARETGLESDTFDAVTYPGRTLVATALLGTAAGFLLARLFDRDA